MCTRPPLVRQALVRGLRIRDYFAAFEWIPVQTEIALLGSTALVPSSTCWITPCLSTTKVVRFANWYSSFRMPYSLLTPRVMSLSRGNVTPICFAKAALAAGLSMLMPRTAESLASSLAVSP